MFLLFLSQFHFAVSKIIRLNSTDYFVMKIPNKRKLQQIVFLTNCVFFQSFIRYWLSNLFKKCTEKPRSILVIDTTLASGNSLHFRKNLLEKNIKVNHDNWWLN